MQILITKLKALHNGDEKFTTLIRKIIVKLCYSRRNDYILFGDKAENNKVNLNYTKNNNLGDMLSPVIVNYMLYQEGITPTTPILEKRHLYAVGSVLAGGPQDCTVWGSGILSVNGINWLYNRSLDIRAIRGPITRALLMELGYKVPEVFGDPAVLMPEIYMPIATHKISKFGLVLHYKTPTEAYSSYCDNKHVKFLNIHTIDYEHFINEMTGVEIVISQSLHGIILAESYGIPAVLLRPNYHFTKYLDWYLSTGRTYFPVADSVEEALSTVPPDLPDLTEMKIKLINSFPYDIYSR